MSDSDFSTLMRYSPPAWRRFLVFLKFSGCRPGEAASMRWGDVRLTESVVVLKHHKTAKKTGRPRLIPLVPTTLRLLLWMRVRQQGSVAGLLERLLRHGPMKGIQVSRFMSHYGISERAVAKARNALGIIKRRVGGEGKNGYYSYSLPPDYRPPDDFTDADFVFTTCLQHPLNHCSISCYMRRLRARSGIRPGVILYGLRHRYGLQGVRNGANLKLLSLAMGHVSTAMTEAYVNAAGLTEDVKQAALQICYGPGAYTVQTTHAPRPIPTVAAPSIDDLPRLLEHVPNHYGNTRPRPHIRAGLAGVPLPKPGADPNQMSIEQMMREMMTSMNAQRNGKERKPTTNKEALSVPHDAAYKAVAWAREQNSKLADAKDTEIYRWLRKRKDCPFKLPPLLGTFQRYVSAARAYYGTRKRIMHPLTTPPRPAG